MANYKLISHAGTGKCLNIYGSGQASQHRNVCLWSDSGTAEQQWSLSLSGNTRILSVLNTAYGLNVWRGSDNMNNCDIYTVSGNEYDSLITVEAVGANYRFKMTNYNLYLTAKGTGNNSDVRWEANNGTNNQQWKTVTIGGGTAPSNNYTYPTDSRKLSQGYGGDHVAIDITGGTGVPIYAFADGTVSYVQNTSGNWSPYEPDLFPGFSMQTFGNMVAINHTNPDTGKVSGAYARTIYAHMRDNPAIRVGSVVKKGSIVGYMGNTGRSSGTHLHFCLMVSNQANMAPGQTTWFAPGKSPTIDPRTYLPNYSF